MTGATIAYLMAGPLCGAIMKYMDGFLGHYGWQWLFVTQGLPATFLGIFAFFYLKDKPEQAGWLTSAEKASVRAHLDNDAHAVETASHGSFWALLKDPKVYTMSIVYFLMLGATYVMVFATPTLIRGWGIKDVFTVGMLSAIGPLFALFGMVLIGRSSDKHIERRRHFLFCCTLGALGALIVILSQGSVAGCVAGLVVLSVGQSSATPHLLRGAERLHAEEIGGRRDRPRQQPGQPRPRGHAVHRRCAQHVNRQLAGRPVAGARAVVGVRSDPDAGRAPGHREWPAARTGLSSV